MAEFNPAEETARLRRMADQVGAVFLDWSAPRPFVVCACPIRNRAWIAARHAAAVMTQTRPPNRLLYVTGDNEDDTEEALRALYAAYDEEIQVDRFDTGCPGWARDGEPRYSINDHAALAAVYNRCIDQALERWPMLTHLWMIDSDILPDSNVLELLLEADKAIISAVVRNSPGAWNFMRGVRADREPQRSQDDETALQRRDKAPFRVTFLSACTLFRREVLVGEVIERWDGPVGVGEPGWRDERKPARYAPDPRSHDFGLVASAKAAGYSLWVHPLARTLHFFHGPGKEPLR